MTRESKASTIGKRLPDANRPSSLRIIGALIDCPSLATRDPSREMQSKGRFYDIGRQVGGN
jgi:hypothetical protein